MDLMVGTFNVNNLFSRFNFRAEMDALNEGLTATYSFADPARFRVRTYEGRLVRGKPDTARAQVAARLLAPRVDVWALQEVEDIDTLCGSSPDRRAAGQLSHLVLLVGQRPGT